MTRSIIAGPVIAVAIGIAVPAPATAEVATWYGAEGGKYTASGERYVPDDLTCAHPKYRFDVLLRVSWRGRSVICRVNDRGPAQYTGVQIDLSRGSARQLQMLGVGRANVTVEFMGMMLE